MDKEVRNMCDADDCVYNSKTGVCHLGAINLRGLRCLDYRMDALGLVQ